VLLTAAVLLVAVGSAAPGAPPAVAEDGRPERPDCTPVWVEADEPRATCDVDALSRAVFAQSGLCRARQRQDADVTVTILDCRKATPPPSAEWVQHDAQVEVRTRDRHATFWASDRHSWAGVGRDLARRTLLWLHSDPDESGPIADAGPFRR
jgi:hypothetical protein